MPDDKPEDLGGTPALFRSRSGMPDEKSCAARSNQLNQMGHRHPLQPMQHLPPKPGIALIDRAAFSFELGCKTPLLGRAAGSRHGRIKKFPGLTILSKQLVPHALHERVRREPSQDLFRFGRIRVHRKFCVELLGLPFDRCWHPTRKCQHCPIVRRIRFVQRMALPCRCGWSTVTRDHVAVRRTTWC
jgi:hypothetical protein